MADDGYEILCNNCRSPVSSEAHTCPHCGESLRDGARQSFEPQGSVLGQAIASGQAAAYPLRTWEAPRPSPKPALIVPRTVFYGGFWIRVAAFLIDSLLLGAAGFFLTRLLGAGAPWLTLVGEWLYFSLLESSANQATVGKIVCGLKVTDLDGRRISFGRATARYFAKILSGLILLIGFAMVGWTTQKRGLHDFIAGTLVLRN